MNNKVSLSMIAIVAIAISAVTLTGQAVQGLVTIDSRDVVNEYQYSEFAQKFGVFEDADNAILVVSDIPYLAHYENTNSGTFKFQEWLEHEDQMSVNEYPDRNEYQ